VRYINMQMRVIILVCTAGYAVCAYGVERYLVPFIDNRHKKRKVAEMKVQMGEELKFE
jgi:hypothetical protein